LGGLGDPGTPAKGAPLPQGGGGGPLRHGKRKNW